MGKKIVAVTNVRHDGEEIEAGAEVDGSKFTKDQLKALYDSGAVTIEDGPDEKEEGPDTAAPVEPMDESKSETPAATPTKATATKATSTDKK